MSVETRAFRSIQAESRHVLWRTAGLRRLIIRKPLGFTGFVVLVLFGCAAIAAPILAPYGYAAADFGARLQGPSQQHLLGTDNLGRDLLSRLMYGAKVSFGISFGAVIVAKAVALVIALVSGYYGGWLDRVAQRFVDIWIAVPTLVLLLTVVAVVGASPLTLILIIGLAVAPGSSRVFRSVVIGIREAAYVEAALATGASSMRIMLIHLLPNMAYMVIYSMTVSLGSVILLVASLGFLGYGVPPPHPDLGAMLSGDGLSFMRRNPWMAVWPGLTITLAVFSFNVFGDALRDILDPRLRGR